MLNITTMNNEEIIKFLQTVKEMTVEEALAIIQKNKQEFEAKKALVQQKKMEWYKSCIGKYFVIDFNGNGTTFTLVHIKKRKATDINQHYGPNNPEGYLTWGECYSVILGDQPIIKGNAGFHPLWLCNPYEEGKVTATCKEITKEEFNKITSPFNSLVNVAKQILKTK